MTCLVKGKVNEMHERGTEPVIVNGGEYKFHGPESNEEQEGCPAPEMNGIDVFLIGEDELL